MKIIAIIANLILLGLSIFFTLDEAGNYDAEMILTFSVFILTPILSIVALVTCGRGEKSWISLWFRRKALEEKKKIEELQSKTP